MLRSMKNLLVSDHHRSCVAQRFAAAGIPRVTGMRSTSDDDPYSVSGPKTIRGGPKFYFNLAGIVVGPIWPQAPIAIANIGGAACGRYVAQAYIQIRVLRSGPQKDIGGDLSPIPLPNSR